jgi:ATP sulfurylase
MRNYLKKIFRKILVKIQANNEFNVFVNEMLKIFEDVEDSLMLKYIVYKKNVNTLSDLLEMNGLYHLTFSKYIIDKRIKLKYLKWYKGELFELKWSDKAKYFLRTLIG